MLGGIKFWRLQDAIFSGAEKSADLLRIRNPKNRPEHLFDSKKVKKIYIVLVFLFILTSSGIYSLFLTL